MLAAILRFRGDRLFETVARKRALFVFVPAAFTSNRARASSERKTTFTGCSCEST
jgi:hypothetical protein